MITGERIPGPFSKLVVLGESTVQGGGWLAGDEGRYADILAHLLEAAQEQPLIYINAGVGASVISPASPGFEASAKPSATERLDEQVIAPAPDLLIAHRIFETIVRACPGIARAVRARDEQTTWTEKIRPLLDAGREPSEVSRPGY